MAAGQSAQRDRVSGQTSLFDLGAEDAAAFERPLPQTTEVPVRERLRWEKELLGLYLSEHPMGEVAEQVGEFVTAYSGDLKDESLDGQRIVVAGIVTGFRTVITKAKSTMGVATLEDLQGSIEVVVFPKLYEETGGDLGARARSSSSPAGSTTAGEEVSLLADLVTDWDGAVSRGPEAFAREVAAGDRGRPPRRQPVPARAHTRPVATTATATEAASAGVRRCPTATVPGRPRAPTVPRSRTSRRSGPRPARATPASQPGHRCRPSRPAEPIPTYREPPDVERLAPDRDVEPALPDEARNRAAGAARRRHAAGRRRARSRSSTSGSPAARERIVSSGAMEAFKGAPRRAARIDPGRPPRPGPDRVAAPCRWSSAAASPTTPSCSPRCAAGSATGSSSSSLAGG